MSEQLSKSEQDLADYLRPAETRPLNAKVWVRETNEHYVEPHWCSERLFAVEQFENLIWDPCCGFGRIPESAKRADYSAIGTDLVDRGYRDLFGTCDFLTSRRVIPQAFSIVCNPPFNIAGKFATHALSTAAEKVAMIFPTARLNAAHWLRETPLARVWLMTPRPSMPPGHTITAGEKPGGGKMDFCWLVWTKGRIGPADLRWLRRDG
jgi:hypothetical protein